MKIGVLAVQGDAAAHAEQLRRLRVETREVRTAAQLNVCDALILPGGESTTQLQFLQEERLLQAILAFASTGRAIFGTCAGAILLAKRVQNPVQPSLGLLDVTVVRNGYGRQMSSEVSFGETALKEEPLEMVFIRAPIIEAVGPMVQVLARHDGKVTLVQSGNILAATFHPELTDDPTVHRHFLSMISLPVAHRHEVEYLGRLKVREARAVCGFIGSGMRILVSSLFEIRKPRLNQPLDHSKNHRGNATSPKLHDLHKSSPAKC